MSPSYVNAIFHAESIISVLDHKISAAEFDEAPRVQLESFRRAFSEMRHLLRSGAPPAKNFGVSRAVVDSWPHSSALGRAIIDAEQAYLHVCPE